MSAASHALRKSLRAALLANASLTSRLGGPRIHDEPPRDAAFPFITLGDVHVADFSTGSGRGEEHQVTLHIWSRQGGRSEAQEIMGEVMQALDDAPLSLAGHALVNLRFAFGDIRRESDGRSYHGVVRFRAVTEPLSA